VSAGPPRPVLLISSRSVVYLLRDRDPVGLSASRSAGFSKWTVLIGRTGFVTISSLPDPTLSLTSISYDNVRQSVTEQKQSKKHGPITSSDQTVPTQILKIRACDWSMLFVFALLRNTLTHFVIALRKNNAEVSHSHEIQPYHLMYQTKSPIDRNIDHVSTLSCLECACTKLRASKEGT